MVQDHIGDVEGLGFCSCCDSQPLEGVRLRSGKFRCMFAKGPSRCSGELRECREQAWKLGEWLGNCCI